MQMNDGPMGGMQGGPPQGDFGGGQQIGAPQGGFGPVSRNRSSVIYFRTGTSYTGREDFCW